MRSYFSLLVMILLIAVVGEGVSAAALPVSMRPAPAHAQTMHSPGERKDVTRIISVLEEKIGRQRLPAQAKVKLAVMPQKDLRLVLALCDRIVATDDRASSDLAVLLAAALIVLS